MSEFTMLIGFLMLFFILAFTLFGNKLVEFKSQTEYSEANATLSYVVNEIRLAKQNEVGYETTFNVSPRIGTKNFTLSHQWLTNKTMLVMMYGDQSREIIRVLPEGSNATLCLNDSMELDEYNLGVWKQAEDNILVYQCPDCGPYSFQMCYTAQGRANQNQSVNCSSVQPLLPDFQQECCDEHCLCC